MLYFSEVSTARIINLEHVVTITFGADKITYVRMSHGGELLLTDKEVEQLRRDMETAAMLVRLQQGETK